MRTGLHPGLRREVDQGAAAAGRPKGAWFAKRRLSVPTTLTCAGHATISTGTVPSTHGIISNGGGIATSSGRVVQQQRRRAEVAYGIARPPAGGSARMLLVPDAWRRSRASAGRPCASSLSMKRRVATMLAGRTRRCGALVQGGELGVTSTAFGARAESLCRAADRAPGRSRTMRARAVGTHAAESARTSSRTRGRRETTHRSGRASCRTSRGTRGAAHDGLLRAVAGSPFVRPVPRTAGRRRRSTACDSGRPPHRLPRRELLGAGHRRPRVRPAQPRGAGHAGAARRRRRPAAQQLDKRVGRGKYMLAFGADHGVAVIPEQPAARASMPAGPRWTWRRAVGNGGPRPYGSGK